MSSAQRDALDEDVRGIGRFLLGPWQLFPRSVTVIFFVTLMVRAAGRAAAMSIDSSGTFRIITPNALTAIVGAVGIGALYWGVPRVFDRLRPRTGSAGRSRYLLEVVLIALVMAVLLHVVTRVLFLDGGVDEAAPVAVSLGFSFPGLILGLLLLNGLLGRIERALRRQERMLERRLVDVQGQRAAVLAADERVRAEIAATLHDDVQTRLLRVAMRLSAIRDVVGEEERAVVDASIDELESTREDGVRAIGRRLAPNLGATGLLSSLRESAEAYAGVMDVEFDFADDMTTRFGAMVEQTPIELAIYRVTEQALQNALKHGRATHARVSLRAAGPAAVRLVIDSDGTGPSESPEPGEGTRVIEAWLGEVGGSWELGPAPDGGARFAATIGA